jgi:hypothetical protein
MCDTESVGKFDDPHLFALTEDEEQWKDARIHLDPASFIYSLHLRIKTLTQPLEPAGKP